MNIQDIGVKIKGFLEDDRTFLSALLIAVAAASFGLGRLSVEPPEREEEVQNTALVQKAPARTSKAVEASPLIEETDVADAASGFVASKNGTKYHLPWCGGVQRITEANKVFFATKEEAEAAGYTPAANCPGI